jgi:KaiC/GvpD/RAD55 family RecA-like ATPase
VYSPYKASHRIGNIGAPLPTPYELFDDRRVKVTFRRGSVSMIAGVPGSFKTALALNLVRAWADKDVCTQYFSVDSDESTITQRLSGIITGYNMDEVENRLQRDRTYFDQELYDKLGDNVCFEYINMGWEPMVYHVKSFEQKFGGYPDLIVIDNLIDLASSVYAFDEMQEIIKNADGLAKKTKAHVMILHHAKLASEERKNNDERADWEVYGMPPADHEIQGKMTQFPTLVLTLGAYGMDIRMAVVKNRFGPQHRNADVSYPFRVNYSMRVVEA